MAILKSVKDLIEPLLVPALDPIKGRLFTTALNLPGTVQRKIVGKPVTYDGQTLAVDTQLMLALMKVSGEPDPSTLPIPKGRVALLRQSQLGGGHQEIGSVRELWVAGLKARLYSPTGASGNDPLLVFVHGGGFIFGDLDSHDAPCRLLASESGVKVLSIDYRLAPEAPFPAAYDDSVAAFRWAVDHAAELGADRSRIGVGGDSAGGNLAAGVALAVGDDCAFQLLIYPVTQSGEVTQSRKDLGEGFYLTSGFIEAATSNYLPEGTDLFDARHAPLHADIPESGIAPAYVATAGFDPLRDEGEAYATKLGDAGVTVTHKRYDDQIHGFLNVVGAGRTARAAVLELAQVLKTNL
ncbi:acetyl esterase [Nocardioides albertanoniae]|uniref:Acetyl esterase n=1 Tax=Nocardioides albertanoniae TaxID=1175486 RepID=A0A543A2W9_9ACTN|nr:alpha/beta hydrolase fold domain-containing protein [Nocardioides albertanoniae]TQL66935.1 acetyl esterase [Nocardioides albertanoniae]